MNKKEFFDRIAFQWDKEHRLSKEKKNIRLLMEKFPLSTGNYVLDAGCGTGRLAPHIRRMVGKHGRIIAADFSGEMIKLAENNFTFKNLCFVQSDAQWLPFVSAFFDVIICFALFPHIQDKKLALSEFRRVLKKGGILVIAHLMNRLELNSFHRRVKGPVTKDLLPDEKQMRALLCGAGFLDLSIRDEPSLYLVQARV
ncbi:MAG: methyltransferase domain-containing protein [Candidatus Aminicenantes bacterium]|nr:methyltransferase domain-containing protein [Candidatus Aminicenantes bacterium]